MDRDQARHVVIGAGPLGLAVVRELRRRGQPVRLVTRSGRAEAPSGAEVIGPHEPFGEGVRTRCPIGVRISRAPSARITLAIKGL